MHSHWEPDAHAHQSASHVHAKDTNARAHVSALVHLHAVVRSNARALVHVHVGALNEREQAITRARERTRKARLHVRFFMQFLCDFAYKICPSLPRTGF